MFRIEDNTAASDVIEQAIAYMQFVAHPSFNILDVSTLLAYFFLLISYYYFYQKSLIIHTFSAKHTTGI